MSLFLFCLGDCSFCLSLSVIMFPPFSDRHEGERGAGVEEEV